MYRFLNNTYDVYFLILLRGPDYKSHSNLERIGGMGLHNIIKLLIKKIVVFKVPFNYNLNLLKDYDLVIKKLEIC